MHLKKGGGESSYCGHSCYDSVRDVVYANITSLNEKVLYIFLATQPFSRRVDEASLPFSRGEIKHTYREQKRGRQRHSPRVDLSTNAHR